MAKHPETNAVRIQTKKTGEKEHSTPLFLTSSFTYDSAEDMAAAFSDDSLDVNIYSRFSNPSVDEFIEKIASLEGAEDGIATATGMAAIYSTFMTFLNQGDHDNVSMFLDQVRQYLIMIIHFDYHFLQHLGKKQCFE